MKKFASLIIVILGVGIMAYAQTRSGASPVGNWTGTWSGGSSGKFEMTIKKNTNGKLTASFDGLPDQGDRYTLQSTLVDATGAKLTIKFDSPDGEAIATVNAVIEGASMKGEYSIRTKANNEEVEKGSFSAKRK